MPIYEYKCRLCGKAADHVVSHHRNRLETQACPSCEGPAEYEPSLAGTHYGGETLVGEGRLIRSEKQLESGWRDQGTTRREGGAGRTLYFD